MFSNATFCSWSSFAVASTSFSSPASLSLSSQNLKWDVRDEVEILHFLIFCSRRCSQRRSSGSPAPRPTVELLLVEATRHFRLKSAASRFVKLCYSLSSVLFDFSFKRLFDSCWAFQVHQRSRRLGCGGGVVGQCLLMDAEVPGSMHSYST